MLGDHLHSTPGIRPGSLHPLSSRTPIQTAPKRKFPAVI